MSKSGSGITLEADKMTEKQFWLAVRRAVLMFIDAIERKWEIEPSGLTPQIQSKS